MSLDPQSAVLRCVDLRGVEGDPAPLLPAPALAQDEEAALVVRGIVDDVRQRGDEAVRDTTERFDGVRLGDLRVPDSELEAAIGEVSPELRNSLEVAHRNILDYHRAQVCEDRVYERDGVSIRELHKPVEAAGLYVPGGRAPLASTVLMTAAPARAAGVERVVMCSPPGPDGRLSPSILAAAAVAGVDEVYRIGGAQAVAAMAFGTRSIPRVDVIVGPGNRYVALAERMVASLGAVGVPSAFTGPSEVVVVADKSTRADFAAIDLVVQAEHGPDGMAYLITWSETAASMITDEVAKITSASPRRAEIEASLGVGGVCILVRGPEQAMEVVNAVAPEHLELMTEAPEALLPYLHSAGAVFVGPWAPASLGDYAAGPNHVLPTARSARFGSALRVDDFVRRIHVIDVSAAGFETLAPHVEILAEAEGLTAHADSVRVRTSPARSQSAGTP